MLDREFFRITILYTFGVIGVLYLMWVLLGLALPEANLNVIRALSTAFGINLPDDIYVSAHAGIRTILVISIISFLSIGMIVLNVFFGAVVTTHFIRPRVNLATSTRGVLSTRWNPSMPYVLVRLSNFHKYDLADLQLSVVLTVQEKRDTGEEFISYLPVQEFTPQRILIMTQRMPWSIAVPGDALLSSSLTKNYHFTPGQPIVNSFSPGKKIVYAKRTLEILMQGIDTHSYSDFVMHKKILVDEQIGDEYVLHLHRGAFKSLPLKIDDVNELEQYVD